MNLSNARMMPKRINVFLIPKKVLSESREYLRKHGRDGNEGFMCWSGIIKDQFNAAIRSCIYAKSSDTSSQGFLHARIGLPSVFEIGQQVYEKREFLLAQLHTHAFEAFHSSVDDNFPISHKIGFISIVVPLFAKKTFYNNKTLVNCSINEYLGFGKWRELSPDEVRKRFRVIKEGREAE